jgi:hypothetical protein
VKSYDLYTGSDGTTVELYEQPAWREIVGPVLYWIDLHKPMWFEPGNGRPTTISHGDGTCAFLWRLRLELWLGYDFHHDKRKVIAYFELPKLRETL